MRLHRLGQLTWTDASLLVEVAVAIVATRLALSVVPFRVLRRWFGRVAERAGSGRVRDAAYEARLLRAVRVIGRWLLGRQPCLTQALVVQLFYGRMGRPTELCIGVMKGTEGDLVAHAWVEYEGKVLVGGRHAPSAYAPLRPVQAGEPCGGGASAPPHRRRLPTC